MRRVSWSSGLNFYSRDIDINHFQSIKFDTCEPETSQISDLKVSQHRVWVYLNQVVLFFSLIQVPYMKYIQKILSIYKNMLLCCYVEQSVYWLLLNYVCNTTECEKVNYVVPPLQTLSVHPNEKDSNLYQTFCQRCHVPSSFSSTTHDYWSFQQRSSFPLIFSELWWMSSLVGG